MGVVREAGFDGEGMKLVRASPCFTCFQEFAELMNSYHVPMWKNKIKRSSGLEFGAIGDIGLDETLSPLYIPPIGPPYPKLHFPTTQTPINTVKFGQTLVPCDSHPKYLVCVHHHPWGPPYVLHQSPSARHVIIHQQILTVKILLTPIPPKNRPVHKSCPHQDRIISPWVHVQPYHLIRMLTPHPKSPLDVITRHHDIIVELENCPSFQQWV
ncbi:G-protein coupled receptor 64 [Striga asiatica]|uniref:G-protein coupled receptor 64 n=1 Tax=Striga asiatica TaxID=4170 RepID=A0A5A7R0X5_STRAF|nr:G-protein coupled receptor 64 [Striga asiatica]